MLHRVCWLGLILTTATAELFSLVIGPTINYTISWVPSISYVDICVSASSPEFTFNHWIALGFVPSDSLRLDNSLIVLGSILTPPSLFYSVSAPTGHVLSTDAPTSAPFFNVTNANFTVALPYISMCFTRPWAAGWNEQISSLQRLIWAIGPMDPIQKVPLSHDSDAMGHPEWHRSTSHSVIDFNVPHTLQIGPKIGYQLDWVTHPSEIDICVSASSSSFTSNTWIALGFTERDATSMIGADVVIGSGSGSSDSGSSSESSSGGDSSSNNSANVVSMFVISKKSLQPFATTTKLNISRTSFTAQLPNLTMCFTRPIESGRHWLTNKQKVLWAVGEMADNKYMPHMSDKNDSSGRSQAHRSMSTPEIDFNILNSVVLGPAIDYTMSWKRSGVFLDFCVSASSWEFTTDTWIAVGFAAPRTRMMQNADIIVGGRSLPPQVLRSDDLWGYPDGNTSVAISGASFTLALPSVLMCFTIAAKSLALGYQQRVIWAVGKLSPDGKILAHWSDAQDPTGKTQLHRSTDGPRINFAMDPDTGKDDPVLNYSGATFLSTSILLLLLLHISC